MSYGDLETDISKYEFTQTNVKKDENDKYTKDIYHQPHQTFLRNWISKNTIYDNILIYHGLGTGKTCVAISIAEGFKEYVSKFNRKIIVLVKNDTIQKNFLAEMKTNCTDYCKDSCQDETVFNKEIKKYYDFHHHQEFIDNYKESLSNTVIIIDEFHNMIGSSTEDMSSKLTKKLEKAYNYRLVLMSATPLTDNVHQILQISNLLNVSDPDLQIPVDYSTIIQNTVQPLSTKTMNKLRRSLKGKVSYVAPNIKDFPTKKERGARIITQRGIGEEDIKTNLKVIKCYMSDFQYNVFVGTGRDPLFNNHSSISSITYPDNKSINVFSEENLQMYSCKLYYLLGIIRSTNLKSLVYSSLVTKDGLKIISQALDNNGYKGKYRIITGNTSTTERTKILNVFNSEANINGEIIQILLASKAISEGVTLKEVREVHIFESDWNLTAINQVIGRAVRNNSHKNLPLEKRTVDIYKYVATSENFSGDDESFESQGLDCYKYILSELKDIENKKVERLLKEIAIDCSFNLKRNQEYLNQHNPGSPECDYVTCELSCTFTPKLPLQNIKLVRDPLDNDYTNTYLLDVPFFSNVAYKLVKSIIIDLFRVHFIWDKDIIKQKSVRKYNNKYILEAVLQDLVSKQEIFTDQFDRPGYLLYRDPYYIFNPKGYLENSSVFSKFVAKFKFTRSVPLILSQESVSQNTPSSSSSPSKLPEIDTSISAEDMRFNLNLMQNEDIYGSTRVKLLPKQTQTGVKFGVKFTDTSILKSYYLVKGNLEAKENAEKAQDNRRSTQGGMMVNSYTLEQLKDILVVLYNKKNPTKPIDVTRLNDPMYNKAYVAQRIFNLLEKLNLMIK
jgi:superfamily II DNA or RNA helicase